MKTIYELCEPRENVFTDQNRNDVLNLSDLRDNNIDKEKFFEETFMTEGLNQLLDNAFGRLRGSNDRGIIRLKQNMGGGKSHCMIALGLLAKNPILRYKLFGDRFGDVPDSINVVAYTGRESDIKYGIWGEIAEQLGKKSLFDDYYSPLSAPGTTAWVKLLKDEKPTLILLDEIPPYLNDAKTKTIGMGTLADVTTTALSNLFVAISKKELSNVLVVISDLNSNYEDGGELITSVFNDLDKEIGRYAMNIEPVNRGNDDLYNILKKKCFTSYPEEGDADVAEIASAYKKELAKARQTGITSNSADALYSGIISSYPFHPCIKNLFGRFKENQNFQQTRGFIRLARNMVRCLWNSGEAQKKFIINAYDVDLRDTETYSDFKNIKPELADAIAHDIVSQGGAPSMAEECDENTNGSHATEELCKMILVSSLANVPSAILGLTESDLAAFMVGPSYSVDGLRTIIENYRGKAWYLYVSKDNKLFYKETKNITAELASRKNGYTRDNAKQYVQRLLTDRFMPKVKDVYQDVKVFPGLDQIELSKDKILLVLFEPNSGSGLQSELLLWYQAQTYKNRVLFLSGSKNAMQTLMETAKEALAIDSIIDTLLHEEHLPETDANVKSAKDNQDRIRLSLCSALREIFSTLYYPSSNGLKHAGISMKFEDNSFNFEEQIRMTLMEGVHKFIAVNSADPKQDEYFRRRIEQRIFTSQKMSWSDVENRAASEMTWNWYLPSTLKDAKNRYIQKGYWVENNGIVDKEPPKPKTDVNIREILRDKGEVVLQITPLHGDTVYWDIGQDATKSSAKIPAPDLSSFRTTDMRLSFLCVDSTGRNETGSAKTWDNTSSCKYQLFDSNGKMCELQSEIAGNEIRYTLDGTDPKSNSAATYITPFPVPKGDSLLQAVTYCSKYGIWGKVLQQRISNDGNDTGKIVVKIDKNKPLTLQSVEMKRDTTNESYDLLASLEQFSAVLIGVDIEVNIDDAWTEFSCGEMPVTANAVRGMLDSLCALYPEGKAVSTVLRISSVKFETGDRFGSWIASTKQELDDYGNYIRQ